MRNFLNGSSQKRRRWLNTSLCRSKARSTCAMSSPYQTTQCFRLLFRASSNFSFLTSVAWSASSRWIAASAWGALFHSVSRSSAAAKCSETSRQIVASSAFRFLDLYAVRLHDESFGSSSTFWTGTSSQSTASGRFISDEYAMAIHCHLRPT